jgi:tRNA(Ile)-lysidine synthase
MDVTVLVAVSGGADSVALLCGLAAVRKRGVGRLVAAHFNHGTRGTESDADEAFVVRLCAHLGIVCSVGRAEGNTANDHSISSEEQAREARYAFLRRTAEQTGARYIVTAHTADDQAETVLHRMLRGTGVAGLAGMRRCRAILPGVSLVRPLLNLRRTENVEYLGAIGQPYRVDASNQDVRFTRNRIRRDLLPQLADTYNVNVVAALTRLGRLAGEMQEVTDDLVDGLTERCVRVQPDGAVTINCRQLAGQRHYLVRELLIALWRRHRWSLRAMSLQRWEQLAALAMTGDPPSQSLKRVFPGGITVERDGDTLTLKADERRAMNR